MPTHLFQLFAEAEPPISRTGFGGSSVLSQSVNPRVKGFVVRAELPEEREDFLRSSAVTISEERDSFLEFQFHNAVVVVDKIQFMPRRYLTKRHSAVEQQTAKQSLAHLSGPWNIPVEVRDTIHRQNFLYHRAAIDTGQPQQKMRESLPHHFPITESSRKQCVVVEKLPLDVERSKVPPYSDFRVVGKQSARHIKPMHIVEPMIFMEENVLPIGRETLEDVVKAGKIMSGIPTDKQMFRFQAFDVTEGIVVLAVESNREGDTMPLRTEDRVEAVSLEVPPCPLGGGDAHNRCFAVAHRFIPA